MKRRVIIFGILIIGILIVGNVLGEQNGYGEFNEEFEWEYQCVDNVVYVRANENFEPVVFEMCDECQTCSSFGWVKEELKCEWVEEGSSCSDSEEGLEDVRSCYESNARGSEWQCLPTEESGTLNLDSLLDESQDEIFYELECREVIKSSECTLIDGSSSCYEFAEDYTPLESCSQEDIEAIDEILREMNNEPIHEKIRQQIEKLKKD